jgi:SSS family solute:Na+ symporter
MLLLDVSGTLHPVDATIFVVYILGMLSIGAFFLWKNKSADDYYVGGRNMGSIHIGLSVVATDVGGGFSIGLGGVGFLMGLSGSWLLFTGLIGAWLAAVLLIPRIRSLTDNNPAFTFPQIFERLFDPYVAIVAALISGIGYVGFTASQILAGAKLASATFESVGDYAITMDNALIVMGALTVVYTVMGGLKAVIFTDTIQWAILLIGLMFVGIPLGYTAVGGLEGIQEAVGPEFLTLTNIEWQDFVNWLITILPIWFVGMTLYQRIYACKDEKTAKRAWYLAGLLEWPLMAFMGVALGLFARVAAEQGMFAPLGEADAIGMDAEQGLPMLLRLILPVGLMGLMLSAYFSAILSTADSCLMASSGNFTTDLLNKLTRMREGGTKFLIFSQLITLAIGGFALWLAASMDNVLDLMLSSYAFMVSGLLVPLIGGVFFNKRTSIGAITAMILGGTVTLLLSSNIYRTSEDLPKAEIIQTVQHVPGLNAKFDLDTLRDLPKEAVVKRLNNYASSEKLVYTDLFSRKEPVSFFLPLRLDPNIFGILAALVAYLLLLKLSPDTYRDPHAVPELSGDNHPKRPGNANAKGNTSQPKA